MSAEVERLKKAAENVGPHSGLRALSSALVDLHLLSQSRAMVEAINSNLIKHPGEAATLSIATGVAILRLSVEQAMAQMASDGMSRRLLAELETDLLKDLKSALRDAREKALRVAENPAKHGYHQREVRRDRD